MTKPTTRKILTGEEIDTLETLINDCGIECTMVPANHNAYHLITATTVEAAKMIKEIVKDLCYSAIGPGFAKNKYCIVVY